MKIFQYFVITIFSAVVLNSCCVDCCGGTYDGPNKSDAKLVTGIVLDDSTGLPIENARVYFYASQYAECTSWSRKDSAYTDADGKFVLDETYTDGYENYITVGAPGHKTRYIRGFPYYNEENPGSSENGVHRLESICVGQEYPKVSGAPQFDGILYDLDSVLIEGFTVTYRAEMSDECFAWSKKDTLVSTYGGRFTL